MDTNVGIDLLGGLLPPNVVTWLDTHILANDICISVINEIELLGFNAPPQATEDLQDLVNNVIVLELARDVINNTIALKKSKR